MASSWDRRDADKEERLYNALGAALNRLIDTEGASNAVIAQACGEFYAQVFAVLSVENGETPEQLEERLPRHLQALQEAVLQRAQAMPRQTAGPASVTAVCSKHLFSRRDCIPTTTSLFDMGVTA